MTTAVRSLGYLVLETDDLDAWQTWATDILGMMLSERTDDRLRLRADEYEYRIEVRRSDRCGEAAVGWEVSGRPALDEIVGRLREDGYTVTDGTPDGCAERQVNGYATLRDPDDLFDIELFHGLKTSTTYFVSPLGHRFIAGRELGLGHIFQMVRDPEVYRHLYVDLLGFRVSDYIDFQGGRSEGTFLHCNGRHHSFAFGNTPIAPKVGHAMLEVEALDHVGVAYDKVLGGQAKLTQTLGRHSNDKMLSFYCKSPSDLSFEFGTDGVLVDDATWTPTRYDLAHFWGHNRQV